jgi:hypothetical protein
MFLSNAEKREITSPALLAKNCIEFWVFPQIIIGKVTIPTIVAREIYYLTCSDFPVTSQTSRRLKLGRQ